MEEEKEASIHEHKEPRDLESKVEEKVMGNKMTEIAITAEAEDT